MWIDTYWYKDTIWFLNGTDNVHSPVLYHYAIASENADLQMICLMNIDHLDYPMISHLNQNLTRGGHLGETKFPAKRESLDNTQAATDVGF